MIPDDELQDLADCQMPIHGQLSEVARELIALRMAARAVIARWDSPLWKDLPATAGYIEDLRRVISAACG